MPYTLSPRETQVTDLLLQGKSNKQIALSLGITERTVEFHLKNVYAKHQVSSRVELILKLGSATGASLRESTVAGVGENAENRERSGLWMGWVAPFVGALSRIGKELEMKTVLNARHVLAGMVAAVLTGMVWLVLLLSINTPRDEMLPWVIPAFFVWVLLGLTVGLIGRRVGNSLLKVAFSAMIGTGASPLTILPLMGMVVLPLGKVAEALGLVNRAALSDEAIMAIAITCMLLVWLVVGTLIGTVLLFISIHKPGQKIAQLPVSQHL